jgi:hypothetical protein
MTALRGRGISSRIEVVLMVLGLGILLGGLLAGCGESSDVDSESTITAGTPLLDKEQPGQVQTASFALG